MNNLPPLALELFETPTSPFVPRDFLADPELPLPGPRGTVFAIL